MAHHHGKVFFMVLLLLNSVQPISSNSQSVFFTLMKTTLKGGLCFSNWEGKSFCNFAGISCDNRSNVIKIDVEGCSLSGRFPDDVCSYLPSLRILRLGNNVINGAGGGFPKGITNCSVLEELDMNNLNLTGTVPDLSQLKSLKFLDISYNAFSGDFPLSIAELTDLEEVNFNENGNFNLWEMPVSFSNLTKMNTAVFTTCMLRGTIPSWIGNMTALIDLELSGNYLVGRIPSEIGFLPNLEQLELYYNQLEGTIPEELGNLTKLIDLDMSVNKLTGRLPESISRLPNLSVLQLYNNSLTGEIPTGFGNSTTLTMLSVYDNSLSGEVPETLGSMAPMILLDMSENQFTGRLPSRLCDGGKLMYFLMLQNMFSGQIPESYSRCNSLLRFRVRYNRLEGAIPEGLLGLPNVSIIDLGFNHLNGTIGKTIGGAKNLSELFLENNMINGALPLEISRAGNLVKIDLSNNVLSGSIPAEIGSLRKLNSLMLQGNRFTSSIPVSLSSLKSLNILDLSNNNLIGRIPQELTELLPNSINLSHNLLSGPIPLDFVKGGMAESFSDNPGLCIPPFSSASELKKFSICPEQSTRKEINSFPVILIPIVVFVVIGIVFFLWCRLKNERATINQDDTSSFFSYDVKSFHRISFDQREIIEAMVEKNIVGKGGSGTVYKMELSNGESVAVKRLLSRKTMEDRILFDRELKTEVDTLGNIRHKNIVKLYCCFSSLDSRLLVYEYMTKGNLWEALHRDKTTLDWSTRHRIAIGIARGMAYLHHDLSPPIIHRDIKTTNILLDGNYHPKVADFGIAKVLQGKDSTTTVVAGTYGYLAPEYAYSSKATTKCDVYSYGVVLMELITGKRPMEKEFGENKNIVYWVSSKVETKEGAMEILDKRVSDFHKDEMIKALRISIRCTRNVPALRPSMNEVVQLLSEAEPCKSCDPHKFSLEEIKNKNST